MIFRRTRIIAAAAAVAAAVLPLTPLVPASAASADTPLLTCLGAVTQSYDPGLLLTPRTVTFTARVTYSTCVGGTVSTGTQTVTASIVNSCLLNDPFSSNVGLVEWNTGQTSELTTSNVKVISGGQIVVTDTGTVTSGLYAGKKVVQVTTIATPNVLDCVGSGVTSASGVVSLTILPV
ncbi:hypothetical protein EV562_103329 [Streptomyces sp. BK208]|uniref:hypothetical protein n=1 Tax=Streptomyces sp. BK208 TaxID=2512150 RepID=UPI00105E17FB|nr:hypothetical protein [Streptomyces sp. BK208]TDT39958.1 hypothetical protein EV562_103329 [Streptomyces sp. BK208]